ncbi:MAG: bifunctional DNA-formamidopyrimidine glycosylase/DNA-(apurinic or apyrimidinic site) lyase [Myxococcales bacterium]|nr:bifunctional DNA-formamidopyrimidine glycosylase/DNA-(apurinic or apyrimidinic site) lyase [Myxococcales bacterium]
MPELPEVEIYRQNMVAWLGDDVVSGAVIVDPTLVVTHNVAIVERDVAGLRAESLRRIGKFLIWTTGAGSALVTHLRMTGKWVPQSPGDPTRFVRAKLVAHSGKELAFVDARRLGQWWWGRYHDVFHMCGVAEFGPDLLDADLTAERLHDRLRGSRRNIKQVLMDQGVLAGVGNIIASEGCFRARVHPAAIAGELSLDVVAALLREIRAHCAEVIRDNVGEPVTYQGEPGAVNSFLVYGRDNQPCSFCQQSIRRVVMGGRSTYFCPQCQSLT